ncbi:MAG: LptF/LptG family permease [Anaerohalosphaeraceae bacterium]|nr:LptF/LptG family permease [Anaerohalosphaeraceae bacterium]
MVFILHRYIFRELMKIFLLSTLGLTVVLSLGSLLRPIQEYGVGPDQVLSLLGYFMPITLTFVLPVAALFSAALVYGRFASDNEFDACKASGISPAMLVYPGLIMAIVVAMANLVLSFHVVPAYVHRAEAAIKADAKQILFRNIQRQGYYSLPNGQFRIYADATDIESSSLAGVVIIDSKKGQAKKLITAESANITFETGEKSNDVKVFAQNAFQLDQHGGVFFKAILVLGQFESLMKENVKFQKIGQMNAIKENPTNYYPIAVHAWGCYERLSLEMLEKEISAALTSTQDNKFYELSNDKHLLRITAEKCGEDEKTNSLVISGNITLYDYDIETEQLQRSYRGEKLFISLSQDSEKRPYTTLLLDFPNATWLDRGVEYIKPRYTISNLEMPETVAAKLGEDIMSTVRTHSYLPQPSSRFGAMVKELERKTRVTMLEIKAEIHSRLVFGIGCITLIMTSIGLGIKIRGGHLLTAFGVSAMPAAALLVFIMMGKNMTKNQLSAAGANIGVIFMWAGLGLLTVLAFVLYRKLFKN